MCNNVEVFPVLQGQLEAFKKNVVTNVWFDGLCQILYFYEGVRRCAGHGRGNIIVMVI